MTCIVHSSFFERKGAPHKIRKINEKFRVCALSVGEGPLLSHTNDVYRRTSINYAPKNPPPLIVSSIILVLVASTSTCNKYSLSLPK